MNDMVTVNWDNEENDLVAMDDVDFDHPFLVIDPVDGEQIIMVRVSDEMYFALASSHKTWCMTTLDADRVEEFRFIRYLDDMKVDITL